MAAVGTSVPRRDGREKVTGRTAYIDDMSFPGAWHGVVVRSPVAHGRLKGRHLDPAFDWSQVVVVTPEDIPGENLVHEIIKDMPLLCDDEIQYLGEPLALVAAPTKDLAREAAGYITFDIEELPSIQTLKEVIAQYKTDEGKLHKFCAQTIVKGDIEKGFEEADYIIEQEYWAGHHEQAYLEPQGLVAVPGEDGSVLIEGSMQCPYFVALELLPTLNLPPEKLRVRQAPTGGAFGGKEEFPTWLGGYVALMAMKSKRTVKLIYDRHEDIRYTTKRHPSWSRYKTGFKKDGAITAVKVEFFLDGGAYGTLSSIVLARGVLHAFIGYRCDNVFIDGRVYRTHSFPCGAFRGFGAPQAIWGLESQMDLMARACDMTPHAFRLRNAVVPGDTTATGQTLAECEACGTVLERTLEKCDFEAKLARCTRGAQDADTWYGVGLAFFAHGSAFTGDGEARFKAKAALDLALDDAERPVVLIRCSSVEMGQGAHTVLPQIVADGLCADLRFVQNPLPDTALVPNSGPTVASRTTMIVGNTLYGAGRKLKAKLEAYASARFFESQAAILKDSVFSAGHDRVDFEEVALAYLKEHGPVRVEHQYELDPKIAWNQETFEGDAYPSYSWGCNVVELEIDRATLQIEVKKVTGVFDVGRVINPMLAMGQLEGGFLQAFGYALLERIGVRNGAYDADRFQTYIIPTMLDAPPFDFEFMEYPYTFSPPGAKGIGELPIDGLSPAVANAIEMAAGIRMTEIPVTPESLFEALRKQVKS
ncbi:MAG: aldehyde oxidase [Spartobacteria bacterium]|nr:aldehyde oxidase [Spartobacteria bacterium]